MDGNEQSVSSIPTSKCGRKLLIADLDKEVMIFLLNLREVGGNIYTVQQSVNAPQQLIINIDQTPI